MAKRIKCKQVKTTEFCDTLESCKTSRKQNYPFTTSGWFKNCLYYIDFKSAVPVHKALCGIWPNIGSLFLCGYIPNLSVGYEYIQ